ncbi:hypothetical protein [Sorangium sp. So ce1000]|uniref:hypothetical protein n=1 Tax=Sorangium sp. So ce1000 TaxID=3133325 RepID=UPI003F5E123E
MLELLVGWRADLAAGLTPTTVRREDTLQHDRVKMEIQIQASTQPLDEVERPVLSAGHAGATLLGLRSLG